MTYFFFYVFFFFLFFCFFFLFFLIMFFLFFFFFSSRRRHTRWNCDWSSDVCSSDLDPPPRARRVGARRHGDTVRWRVSHTAPVGCECAGGATSPATPPP